MNDVEKLRLDVEAVVAGKPASNKAESHEVISQLLDALEEGSVRSATKDANGQWNAVPWVKQGILLGFRIGKMTAFGLPNDGWYKGRAGLTFVDKDTYPPREFLDTHGIRIVPGGSSIRRGTFIAKGVICMPPMYINVGAYVDEGTMVDSHALVGSCAQIGKRVHISAAAQIGGVLEPVNASPVVIEDNVLVGGNCGVYEGTVVRANAVLAAGVVLTRGTPVFDLVKETIYKGDAEHPLEIPEGAVVVPGAREIGAGWGKDKGLSLQAPVIVKYRDEKTNLATALEDWLR